MIADRTDTANPIRRFVRPWSLAAILALAAGAPACKREQEKPADGDKQAAAAVPVAAEDAARAQRKTIRIGPRIAGSLDARKRADMRAEASGQVLEVNAELGQAVKKGQVLARIEANAQGDSVRSAEAGVRSARENLSVASRQVERTKALVEGGALAERDLETAKSSAVAAEAQLGQARAQLATARTQLSNATVRSPMDGVVSKAPVHTGDVVAPGAELFTIIDPSTMRLEASVPSDDLQAVAVGTPVAFEVRGYPGQKFKGTIERVAPAADPATRQIPILISIPNESGKLVAGLFAEGRLAGGTREALVVPAAAVDSSGESPTVTRVNKGVVERINVQLGARDGTEEVVEVVSGLAEGDIVLLRNARALPPGTRVDVSGQGSEAPAAAAPKPAEAVPTAEVPTAAKPSGTAER
ncbi:MAG TPA: efflux RND transporter periplasmic adaptor subunit [Kofleriaceae bacterium]|nr:efflux RND transporter periplasmic adaptor subunit [Kofleriaceae bacterium]